MDVDRPGPACATISKTSGHTTLQPRCLARPTGRQCARDPCRRVSGGTPPLVALLPELLRMRLCRTRSGNMQLVLQDIATAALLPPRV
jgi:hypothetical protein